MIDSDIDLVWGGDIVITSSGSVGVVTGQQKILQRVVRRFLTTSQSSDAIGQVTVIPDYYFHPDYGGSARTLIDNPYDTQTRLAINQRFASQAAMEQGVAAAPPPAVTVTYNGPNLEMDATVYTNTGSAATVANLRVM